MLNTMSASLAAARGRLGDDRAPRLERARPLGAAIVDGERKAGVEEPAGHPGAHDAEAEEGDAWFACVGGHRAKSVSARRGKPAVARHGNGEGLRRLTPGFPHRHGAHAGSPGRHRRHAPESPGPAVAEWFLHRARLHGKFTVDSIDLATVNLPMFDEPRHPRLGQYEHEHTKRWSATVARADAFVFVTPEYNYGAPPSIVNAIDYLNREWAYKPVGFVSYGGVSGGTRSVQMIKQIVTVAAHDADPGSGDDPLLHAVHRQGERRVRAGRDAGDRGDGDARRAAALVGRARDAAHRREGTMTDGEPSIPSERSESRDLQTVNDSDATRNGLGKHLPPEAVHSFPLSPLTHCRSNTCV